MSEIINKGIDNIIKGNDIDVETFENLFVIIRHKFNRSIHSQDEMAFKLFKMYYALYHQHQKCIKIYQKIPWKDTLEILESCTEAKAKLENMVVYFSVKSGWKDQLISNSDGLSENGKQRILRKIEHMSLNH